MTYDFIFLRPLMGMRELALYIHYIHMMDRFSTRLISTEGQHCIVVAASLLYIQYNSLDHKFKKQVQVLQSTKIYYNTLVLINNGNVVSCLAM